jgi:selenocysteine-specific elongation factor
MQSGKSIIVGTAGHIDHGKSSLIEALTGTHPDRLEEEKRRGITIDLGFAFLEESGVHFGFVDVPGHERFVKNMLAGAAGIDLVLLVIAADESIKPQTREHFEICRLLGVKQGVIALTKCDLVDRETQELARLEIEDYLRGSFLHSAPIVPVSARKHEHLDQLKSALSNAAQTLPGKDSAAYFRLPIDRAFAMKGFGAVVTGTLISGSVRAGDEVQLFPSLERLRVRGVQSGGKVVERAIAGQRTAINLAGIEHATLQRGMVLASPGKFRLTRRMDARLELLAGTPKLKQRAKVHFHIGASETIAEVYLLDRGELASSGQAFVHLRLRDELLALPGDRFIIRQFSPVTTIGGGTVLDTFSRRPTPRDTGRVTFLQTLEHGDEAEIVSAMTERMPMGLSTLDVIARTGWSDDRIRTVSQTLAAAKRVKIVSGEQTLLLPAALFADTIRKITERVEKFHKENSLVQGITREELRASLGRRVRSETFRAAIDELVAAKKLELQGEIVKRAGSAINLDPEETRAKQAIEAAFSSAGLSVPSSKEVLAALPIELKRAERILQMLLRERTLVRVSPELIFHRDALSELRERLAGYKKTRSERISVPAFKELTGVTRKYAIPLLEYLDRERVTRRAGDERVIL